ncbi:MAG: 2,3-bisphosphoglycerate-independent phosphoglycerate mutase [Planctomycetaceae bacterium]|nr:2,3-bisphosphoglycerate-independent phosphoglycerate mutase [Planctomycetaceae bacterium]
MSIQYKGPVVLVVMDGVGLNENTIGNAVAAANKPTLDRLLSTYPVQKLKAHGTAVGLPSDDDMGNSEVGHNALGAGQVYSQGAKLVNESIATGRIFESDAWHELVDGVKASNGTFHFLGLLSDGNVHSHIDHLLVLLGQVKAEGVARARVHILLDGRDVGETSALEYVDRLEARLAELNDGTFDAAVASGGGRMQITMDRYEANWSMVERGWHTHVLGEGQAFSTATDAIRGLREAHPGVIDQDLPPFVIHRDGRPAGTIEDGDSVLLFNFRGDRALEITRAFEQADFDVFDRIRHPQVRYAGMLEYDGDLHIPARYLVSPPEIQNTLGERLAQLGISQLAISETQKYGHVTYFFNGNRTNKFSEENEDYVEILSDVVPFEQRPWMRSAEITDELIARIRSGKYRFVRVNYPNGDMVGHTGIFQSTQVGVESLDIALSRLLPVIDAAGGMAIITADHGNAEEMYELDKKTGGPSKDPTGRIRAKTSHTLNKVPCIFYDNTENKDRYSVKSADGFGLANVAATVADLLGVDKLPMWNESMIEEK